MTNFAAHLAALKDVLELVTPASKPVMAPDAYPGLRIEQSPAEDTDLEPLVNAVMEAVAWPEYGAPIPYVTDLSAEQRELVDVLADAVGVPLYRWAIPQTSRARRLWLGLDDPGALAREVEYEIEGEERRAPLWRALWELDNEGDSDDAVALFESLPLADRIAAYGELAFEGFRCEPPVDIEDPGSEAGEWARAYADRLVSLFADDAPHIERDNNNRPPSAISRLVFTALHQAGAALEERWDSLLPFDFDLIEALPSERRAAAIVRGLEAEFPRWAINKGRTALARFPSAPVVEHLLERADQCIGSIGCPPRREYLAELRDSVADHAQLAAMVDAHIAALPPIPALRCTRKLYPRNVDELTDGQRTQLAILGRGWETDDGPIVDEGDDGEVVFGRLEYVSAYEIADADGQPAFEALLYMDEDGAVCRAGTTNSVAYVCQERLDWNIDVETVEALHAILHERPAERPE